MSELAVINVVDKVGSDLDPTACINSNSNSADNIKDICIDKILILENNSTKDEDTPMDEKRVNGIDPDQGSLLENGAGKLVGGCSDFTRSDDDLESETGCKETTNASCVDNSKQSDMDSKLSEDDIELQDDNDNPSGFAIVAVTSDTDTVTTTSDTSTCVLLNDDGGDHGIEKVSNSNDHPEPVEIAEPDESQVKGSLSSDVSQKESTGGDDSFVMDQDDIDILLEEDEGKRAEKPESKPEEIDTMVPTSKSEPKLGEKEYEARQCHPLQCPQGDGDAPSSDAHLADVISEVEDEAHSHMESKTEKLPTLDSKEETSVTSDDLLQPDKVKEIDLTQDGDASQQNVNVNDACNISEEMKLKTLGESHDSQQAMSPSSSNSDNAATHPSEEAEDKNENSLMISKVESCFNEENEEMEWKNDNSQDSIKYADIKDGEVKEKVEKEEKEDTNDKSNEIEDSKEDCGVIINECKSLNNEEFDSINTEANESIKKDDTGTKNETTDQEDTMCVASDSTVKFSFKDILKRKPSQELSVLTQETKNDPEEAIVIDETESVPIDSANERKSEVLREKEISPKVMSSEKNETLKVEASSTVGEHHKKRVLSEEPESPSLKRPRIDSVNNEVVAKPIEVEATTVIMDSDEDSAPSPLGLDKDVPKDGEKETNQHTLKLSSQMLEKLVKASLKSFMKNQKQEKEQLIDDRMRKMENATDLWRETAKHLEKSVNELTSYTKELRKRKSQAMKLKNLSSRTVAVQVSLERTPNNQPLATNSQIQNHSQVPHRSTSLSLPPSVLRHPNAKGLPNSPPYQVRMGPANGNNMRPNHPQQQLRTPTPRGTSPMPPGPQQMNRNRFVAAHQNSPLGQSLPSPSQQNPVMRQNLNSHVPQQPTGGRLVQGRPVNASMSHSFQASESDTIDLTDEDDMSKSSNTLLPSTRLPHSSVLNGHGSQPVRGVPPQNNNAFMSSNNQSGGPRMHNAHNTPPSRKASIPGSNGQYVHADNTSKLRNGNQLPNASSTAKSGVFSKSGSINGLTNQSPGTESTSKGTSRSLPPSVYVAQPSKHPAPLPNEQNTKAVQTAKLPPPKPSLKISRVSQGIVLSWNMPPLESNIAKIASYQLFAYQETNSAPSSSLWKKVGDVKALPLPMACTLVQFQEGNKYFFAVRAVDQFGRWGEYSDPSSIYLFPK